MSYSNRYEALSWSDAESLDSPYGSPVSVLGRNNKNNKVEMDNDEKEFSDEKEFGKRLLRGLQKLNWRTFAGKPIDKVVLKKYLDEVKDSGGFDINHYPGYIYGVTRIRPHFDISYKYDLMMELAMTAIKTYNKHHQSHFKVTEIKRVNSIPGAFASIYFITFNAVDVKGLKRQSNIFRQFAATITRVLTIFMLTLLVWLGMLLPPYNLTVRSLERLLLKMKSGPALKANDYELSERSGDCTTFQAKVGDNVTQVKRGVFFCRAVPK